MLLSKRDRVFAARRFVEANDRRVAAGGAFEQRAAHDAAWRALVAACDGNRELADAEVSAVFAETPVLS